MSAHFRARPRCINMQAERPVALSIGACATATFEAKALAPRKISAVRLGLRDSDTPQLRCAVEADLSGGSDRSAPAATPDRIAGVRRGVERMDDACHRKGRLDEGHVDAFGLERG